MASQTQLEYQRLNSFGKITHRWGVILAGGDGTRLLPFTRLITGDERPKQFCAIAGTKTLLDQTRDRVGRILRPQQTLILVTKTHEQFYESLLSSIESPILVQPYGRGTAPAIAYSLFRLRELDPSAVVAIFPSDHHFANESAFTASVESAFDAAETHSDRVMLLGISPDYPEPAYGWIEPGAPLGGYLPESVRRVSSFWEKPSPALASALMADGCLWNSFIMVGHVHAFLGLIQRALPTLSEAFEAISLSLFTKREEAAVLNLYDDIISMSFSDEVLTECPDHVAVVRAGNLGWSDLGEPPRVLSALEDDRFAPSGDYEQWKTSSLVAGG